VSGSSLPWASLEFLLERCRYSIETDVTRPSVAGVDGAPGGWLVARSYLPLGFEEVALGFVETIDDLVGELESGELSAMVIDIPIGLSGDGYRPADGLARERLGSRRSTFFPTPTRAVLECETWDEANQQNRAASGRGLSKQAWNLVPKIQEVDAAWSHRVTEKLLEGHPETSFGELAGAPLKTNKNTLEGRAERLGLLRGEFGADLDAHLAPLPNRYHVDAIDAAVLTWTATRVVGGAAVRLGGELDPAGRPMALWV